jgi:hemoglobin
MFPGFGAAGAPAEFTREGAPEEMRLGGATACRAWTMILAGEERLELSEGAPAQPRRAIEPRKSRFIRPGVGYRIETPERGRFTIAWFANDPLAGPAARRKPHPAAPGVLVGVDEDLIRRIVVTFYARIRRDQRLAPIFDEAIRDWPAHLERMCDFWSSVILITGAYKGGVVEAHAGLAVLESRHFERWLELFNGTAAEFGSAAQASLFRARALRIARRIEARGATSPSASPCAACQPFAGA